ncbi:MAG: helix-turn-helix domain-containing protein [Thermoleophilia bacterium]|jgi:transcriptional regulator with XRE-family HTH domain|nr:helix-turn-helix domain-containing protein [Thermoleophilia bacterium]
MPVAARQKIVALSDDLGSRRRLAEVLGVNPSQVSRWAQGGGMDPENAERLDLLELVMSALARLYEPEVFEDWLLGVNPHLGDRRPVDVIRSRDLESVLKALRAEQGLAYS